MVKRVIAIGIFMACVMASKLEASPPSLSPSLICSVIMYDMADCFWFLINGSTEDKPIPSCCSGFKAVLTSNADCLCEALKSGPEFGIDVNLTKAAALPSACQVFDPPMSKCNANPPSPDSPEAPAISGPSNSQPPSSTAAVEVSKHAPAPAVLSGTYSLSACFFVIISMLVISFSCISV